MNPVEKYNARARKINSMLCVGLDADFDKMPERFKTLGGSEAQFQFNKYIIDSTYEYAAAFKPNAAFFESRGTDGVEALKKTMDYIHEKYPDVFTVGNRQVKLSGEAFFDVVKDDLHPFLVRAGKMDIEVKGTRFNV
ncbi:MAG: FecR domain-containing protein, partial [bacterium]